MNHLIFVNQTKHALSPLKRRYQTILKQAQKHLKIQDAWRVEVVMVRNEIMQQYNQHYRQKNYATDVLSFPLHEKIRDHDIFLGVIMIAYDKAVDQANAYGHSLQRELSFLFIHGILHLLGYDHQTEKAEQEMLALQDAIIGKRVHV